MTARTRQSTLRRNAIWIFLVLSATGCWASKEETATQLQTHITAYRNVTVTPNNAENVIKGAKLLLQESDKNNFSKAINPDQKAVLEGAIKQAEEVIACANRLDAWKTSNPKDSWKQWNPRNPSPKSSSQLKAEVGSLKSMDSCDQLISLFSQDEKSEINRRIKDTSNLMVAVSNQEEVERKRKEAEEKKQECSNAFANAEKARQNFLIYSNAGDSGNYGWASSMDYKSQAKDAWSELNRLREFLSENCR